MTKDEKKLVNEAIDLLALGTSNSLSPERRAQWSRDRDRLIKKLGETARRHD